MECTTNKTTVSSILCEYEQMHQLPFDCNSMRVVIEPLHYPAGTVIDTRVQLGSKTGAK